MADEIANPLSPEPTAVQPPEGQGAPTDSPSPVQPAGQGQPDGATGLFDLSSLDETVRPTVEPFLKDIERNVNGKFAEHAEYRKRYEGFDDLGLDDVGPEGIAALLEFAEALTDPDGAKQAILDLAENVGVDLGAAAPAAPEGEDEVTALRATVEALEARLNGRDEQDQFTTLQREEATRLRIEWDEVEAAHKAASGQDFSDEEKERLKTLARRFVTDHPEPIKAAYEFIQNIAGAATGQFVSGAPTPPAAPTAAGAPSTTVEPTDDFDVAQQQMIERRRAAAAV